MGKTTRDNNSNDIEVKIFDHLCDILFNDGKTNKGNIIDLERMFMYPCLKAQQNEKIGEK